MEMSTLQKYGSRLLVIDQLCIDMELDREWSDNNGEPRLTVHVRTGIVVVSWFLGNATVKSVYDNGLIVEREEVQSLHTLAYLLGVAVSDMV